MSRHFTEEAHNQQLLEKVFNISASLVIREKQIKNTQDFISPQLECLLSRIQATIGVGKDVGKKVHSYIAGEVANWCSHSEKQLGRFLRKLGIQPPLDPPIPLLGLYAKDLKSAYYSDTATLMCIAAQVTIALPRCPSTDKWIKKIWHIYIMEYYLTIKKNDFMTLACK